MPVQESDAELFVSGMSDTISVHELEGEYANTEIPNSHSFSEEDDIETGKVTCVIQLPYKSCLIPKHDHVELYVILKHSSSIAKYIYDWLFCS